MPALTDASLEKDNISQPAFINILAVCNFYRDVLKYDAFGDSNRALALVINDQNDYLCRKCLERLGRKQNFYAYLRWFKAPTDN